MKIPLTSWALSDQGQGHGGTLNFFPFTTIQTQLSSAIFKLLNMIDVKSMISMRVYLTIIIYTIYKYRHTLSYEL